MIRPNNSNRFDAIAPASVGDEATYKAATAVMASPAHIQPYTARRKAETRSTAGSGVLNAESGVVSYGDMANR
jgi:hypothetical protein